MRTKTANELLKLIRMLFSEDEEVVKLGIGLFQDCYLLTNMNKHKKFTIEYGWLGFTSDKPYRFRMVPERSSKKSFTKSQFIKMLNSNDIETYTKAYHIICFVNMCVDSYARHKNRNYNPSLSFVLRSPKRVEHDIKVPNHSCYSKRDYYRRTNKVNTKLIESIDTFHEELKKLKVRDIPRDLYDAQTQYKQYMFARFKNTNLGKNGYKKMYDVFSAKGFNAREIDYIFRHYNLRRILSNI